MATKWYPKSVHAIQCPNSIQYYSAVLLNHTQNSIATKYRHITQLWNMSDLNKGQHI